MKIIKLSALSVASLSFASCNTLIGVGRDIKQAGAVMGGSINKAGSSVGNGLENKGYGKTWNGSESVPKRMPNQ